MGFASAGEESGNGRWWGEWKLNAGSHRGTLRCRTLLSPAGSGGERVSAAGGSRDALRSPSEATAGRGRGENVCDTPRSSFQTALARVRRLTLPSPLVGEGLGERGRTLATRLAPLPSRKRSRAHVGCRQQPTRSRARAKRRQVGARGGQNSRHAFPPLPNPSPSRGEGLEARLGFAGADLRSAHADHS